eukprot:m.155673 g.155673  ORF g.155673 m.155673 type:complete len:383 (-) comp13327_c1_seq1:1122-2270(-)
MSTNGNGDRSDGCENSCEFVEFNGVNFRRKDLVRILSQTINKMGFSDSAQKLQDESGVEEETEAVKELKEQIKRRDWEKAISTMDMIGFNSAEGKKECEYVLWKEYFIQLVDENKQVDALKILRANIAMSAPSQKVVGNLSKYLFSSGTSKKYRTQHDDDDSDDEEMTQTQMDTQTQTQTQMDTQTQGYTQQTQQTQTQASSVYSEDSQTTVADEDIEEEDIAPSTYEQLLGRIEKHICPLEIVPSNRLFSLLSQAFELQMQTCVCPPQEEETIAQIITNHMCTNEDFPSTVAHTLDFFALRHKEVWNIEFNHKGTQLAVAGEAFFVVVYETATFKIQHTLEHEASIRSIDWSDDDKYILTCCDGEKDIHIQCRHGIARTLH